MGPVLLGVAACSQAEAGEEDDGEICGPLRGIGIGYVALRLSGRRLR